MPRFMVPVKCFEGAIDALSWGQLQAGPPLPRAASSGSTSVAYPVFVDAVSETEAERRVRDLLPMVGYEVADPERLPRAAVTL